MPFNLKVLISYLLLKGCMKTCYQNYVITKCGCADAYYPKEGKAFPTPVPRSCDPSNITQGN